MLDIDTPEINETRLFLISVLLVLLGMLVFVSPLVPFAFLPMVATLYFGLTRLAAPISEYNVSRFRTELAKEVFGQYISLVFRTIVVFAVVWLFYYRLVLGYSGPGGYLSYFVQIFNLDGIIDNNYTLGVLTFRTVSLILFGIVGKIVDDAIVQVFIITDRLLWLANPILPFIEG